MNVWSIDPGARHIGWARRRGSVVWSGEDTEFEVFLHALRSSFESEDVDLVVVEGFALYPWKSKQKSFSSFPEVELIGAIRWLCFEHGVLMVVQPASVKKPAEGFVRSLKLDKWLMMAKGRHAKDAVLHLVYALKRKGEL